MSKGTERQDEAFALYDLGRKMWRASAVIDRMVRYWDMEEVMLVELRVKLPEFEGGEYMVVAKGVQEGQRLVAFHNGTDLGSAVAGAISRYENKSLKWREDKWKESGGAAPTG